MSLFWSPQRPATRAISSLPWARGEEDAIIGGTTALSLVPVYSAVRLISEAISSLPLHQYRDLPDGTKEQLPLTPVVESMAWLQRPLVSLLTQGNAFGIVRGTDKYGRPRSMDWVDPNLCQWFEGRWHYRGKPMWPTEILHVPAFTQPGQREGLSPIRAFAETLDAGLEQQRGARQWARNRQVPGLKVRNSERTLKPREGELISERMKSRLRSGEPFVTGKDWDLDVLAIPPGDAAFLESIKATATQVAAIYNLPPEKIGGTTGASLTYNTVEQQAIEILMYGLRPWMVRLEQALGGFLLPRGQYLRFNADAMIRVDTKTRHEIYKLDREIGLRNVDELRLLEDLAPLPDGQGQDYTPLKASGSGNTDTSPGGTA